MEYGTCGLDTDLLRESYGKTDVIDFGLNSTQRNSMQQFLCGNKMLRRPTFYATADVKTALAASCGKIETTSIFFRNAGDKLYQSELRLRSTHGCGIAERRGNS